MHRKRCRQIERAHPEVRALMRRDPSTALWIAVVFTVQLGASALVSAWPIWAAVAAGFTFGAILSLALWTLLHECTHDLVLKSRSGNRWLGIVAGLPLIIPSASSFRKYHLLHHRYPADPCLDGDVPSRWEFEWVGGSRIRRACWLFAMPLMIALRPGRMKQVKLIDRWFLANLACQLAFDLAVILLLGWSAFAYLLFSNIFCLGLHPLGGRWLQEHLGQKDEQGTASYYGWLNALVFNAGYHVEHHDLPRVPWSSLRRLKDAAPEFYQDLRSYRSWSSLVWEFLRADGEHFKALVDLNRGSTPTGIA